MLHTFPHEVRLCFIPQAGVVPPAVVSAGVLPHGPETHTLADRYNLLLGEVATKKLADFFYGFGQVLEVDISVTFAFIL